MLGGVVPASMVAILLFLTIYAWPAIVFNGVGFIGEMSWNLGSTYADPVDGERRHRSCRVPITASCS